VISTDTSIEFEDTGSTCTKWSSSNVPYFSQYASVAFDIDDSGAFNDLPNRKQTVKDGFISIVDNGTTCTLTLKSPAGKNYPVSTKIRAHYPGSSYNYIAADYSEVPANWKEYRGEVTGQSLK
jgi:hypothetical protein